MLQPKVTVCDPQIAEKGRTVPRWLRRPIEPESAVPDDFPPVLMRDIDLEAPLPDFASSGAVAAAPAMAHVVVRLHGIPLGAVVLALAPAEDQRERLAQTIEESLGAAISAHLRYDGIATIHAVTTTGLRVDSSENGENVCRYLRTPAILPAVSVVVATHRRPAQAIDCITALLATEYPNLELLIVNNAPEDGDTATLRQAFANEARLTVLDEPIKGTSRARNTGIAAATGDIIAMTDDDVVVDPRWLLAMVQAFSRDPGVGCVTGQTQPKSLDGLSKVWFEEISGFTPSSVPRTFTRHESNPPTRLYPYTSGVFGAGNNMAVRAEALRAVGNFDERLGPGTPTHGAEDLDLLTRIVLGGHAISYEPAALVRHDHRADVDALERQLYTYGLGATAMLTKWALRDPRLIARALTLPFRRDPGGSTSVSSRAEWPEPPASLYSAVRRGKLAGPGAWVRSAIAARGRSRSATGGAQS
jgi:GT2 family glycosyltransferase